MGPPKFSPVKEWAHPFAYDEDSPTQPARCGRSGHRRQLLLLAVSLVDYPKNPVRFIEAAVDGPPLGLLAASSRRPAVRAGRVRCISFCLLPRSHSEFALIYAGHGRANAYTDSLKLDERKRESQTGEKINQKGRGNGQPGY